uniref:Uncharacterized protein n=1 Tax=Tanacetum cinerariifolium TaxID=118510 RepID=A0A6L2MBG6_TANCI|nr:hypothetical protein [Tanacetum cinerariifolium]
MEEGEILEDDGMLRRHDKVPIFKFAKLMSSLELSFALLPLYNVITKYVKKLDWLEIKKLRPVREEPCLDTVDYLIVDPRKFEWMREANFPVVSAAVLVYLAEAPPRPFANDEISPVSTIPAVRSELPVIGRS